jgi:hypothetical protein
MAIFDVDPIEITPEEYLEKCSENRRKELLSLLLNNAYTHTSSVSKRSDVIEFDVDSIEIDPDDYLNECTPRERDEIFSRLTLMGYVGGSYVGNKFRQVSPFESQFEDSLNKIHGRYSFLGKEDQEIIINIALKL